MVYMVVFDPCIHDLIIEVNKYLEAGWKCQGGICVDTNLFLQAIVFDSDRTK